jgi:anti-anti-sigma factor
VTTTPVALRRSRIRSEVVLGRDVERSAVQDRIAHFGGSFEITHRQFDGTSVLDVHGELDLAHAPALGVAVHQALGTTPSRLVIDLCGVTFVDPRGLSVLLSARRRARRVGVELRLACNVESTLRLLALTKLDRDFDVRPTRAEALSLGSGGS